MATVTSMMNTNAAGLKLGSLQRSQMSQISRLPQRDFRVRCKADSNEPKNSPNSSSAKKVRTKLVDVFAISGPAQETINGRVAMVGFVSAIGVELASGRDLISQINSEGVAWFVLSAGVITFASLVPMLKGISVERKSEVPWSSKAEMWNGRYTMMGCIALVVTEYVSGGPLV